MQKYFLVAILFLLLGVSCQEEEPLMSSEKLVPILADLHIAESFAQLVPMDMGGYETKNYDTLKVLYAHIYKQNNIDTTSFNQVIDWYEQHPKLFDKVYEKVLAELSLRKEKHSAVDSIVEYSDTTDFKN